MGLPYLPDDVLKIVQDQVSFFRNFTPHYILNHYKLGPTDLIVRIKGEDVMVLKNYDAFQNKKTVEIRCKLISQIVAELYSNGYSHSMKDLDIIVPFCFSDKSESPVQHIPALCFSKERYSNNILVPSVNNLVGYQEFDHVDSLDRPLLHKVDKMCFVGSLTNINWNEKGIAHNQRLHIGDIASRNPDMFFCKIKRPPKFDDVEWKEVSGRVKEYFPDLHSSDCWLEDEDRVSIDDQLKYKFQICVDGHTCAWARLPWQMRSNSVPIKIRNPHDDFTEWFYPLLDPSKHFLEVPMDSLLDVYEYIKHEPEHQIEISRSGREFVDKYLNAELAKKIFLTTLLLINEKQTVHMEDPQ